MTKKDLQNALATIFQKEGEVVFNGVKITSINDDGDWVFIVGEGDNATPYRYYHDEQKITISLEDTTDIIWREDVDEISEQVKPNEVLYFEDEDFGGKVKIKWYKDTGCMNAAGLTITNIPANLNQEEVLSAFFEAWGVYKGHCRTYWMVHIEYSHIPDMFDQMYEEY